MDDVTLAVIGMILLIVAVVALILGFICRSSTNENDLRISKIIITCSVIGIFVAILMMGPNFSKTPKDNSDEKGYWGSDGYYNPTDKEMEQYIREAEEWIKNN